MRGAMSHAQNGTFNRSTITKAVSAALGDSLHSKTTESLSNSVLGLVTSRNASIHSMGRGLAEATGKDPKHTIKQTDRMLSNDNISIYGTSEKLALFVIGLRKKIYAALDWIVFGKDGHHTIVLSLVTKHGRATPLLWKTVDKDDLKGNMGFYENQVLTRFYDILPKDVEVTLLADSRFL